MAPYHGHALYCIGGPLHGKLRAILHGNTLAAAAAEPMSVTDPRATRPAAFVHYDPREVRFPSGEWAWFWVLHDHDPDDALRKIEDLLGAQ